MSDLFSDLQLQDIALLDLQFSIANRAPARNARITVTMETTKTKYDETEGGVMATTRMSVKASLTGEADKGDKPGVQFSAHAAILYQAPPSIDVDDAVRLELRSRSLADGYSFVRNQAMLLASLSPIEHLVLPSIDIASLV